MTILPDSFIQEANATVTNFFAFLNSTFTRIEHFGEELYNFEQTIMTNYEDGNLNMDSVLTGGIEYAREAILDHFSSIITPLMIALGVIGGILLAFLVFYIHYVYVHTRK